MGNWHALYVRSRFEKKVFASLTEEGLEVFLPLQKTLRQWKDRKKWVYEPLFRSYCFVKVTPKTYPISLTIPGVVKYIWFNGKPAIISEFEIEMIKSVCESNYKATVIETPVLKGQTIKVNKGIFTGYEGEVLYLNGKHKVVFRVSNLPVSLVVQIPKHYVQVL